MITKGQYHQALETIDLYHKQNDVKESVSHPLINVEDLKNSRVGCICLIGYENKPKGSTCSICGLIRQ